MKGFYFFISALIALSICSCKNLSTSSNAQDSSSLHQTVDQWSVQKINKWYKAKGDWLVGCNYTPAYAVNQLEFWQKATFDTARIDKELGWAEDLGFNMVRVFLHNLLWKQDSTGFLNRIDQFLTIADRHDIGVMFVFFDGVWNPFPQAGKQPAPVPHVHNSGWVQSPGAKILSDTTQYGQLKEYVQGVMRHFSHDSRVWVWDLFNEPDNDNGGRFPMGLSPKAKYKYSFILLKKSFKWARSVQPEQPLTAAPWHRKWADTATLDPMDRFMFNHSDIISFHCYAPLKTTKKKVKILSRYKRPMICSEYMARPTGSTFENILPFFKKKHVGALNWGFVDGKTQTIYPWDSWTKEYTAPPKVWFHDILYSDGKPYDSAEVALIKQLTGKD